MCLKSSGLTSWFAKAFEKFNFENVSLTNSKIQTTSICFELVNLGVYQPLVILIIVLPIFEKLLISFLISDCIININGNSKIIRKANWLIVDYTHGEF